MIKNWMIHLLRKIKKLLGLKEEYVYMNKYSGDLVVYDHIHKTGEFAGSKPIPINDLFHPTHELLSRL